MADHNDPQALEQARQAATSSRVPEAPVQTPLPLEEPKRSPPTKATVRALAAAYKRAEIEASKAEAEAFRLHQMSTDADRHAKQTRTEARKALAVLNLALRSSALGEPMPTEAEADAATAIATEQLEGDTSIVVPDGCKAGQVIKERKTGRRFRVVEHNGSLLAFPEEG